MKYIKLTDAKDLSPIYININNIESFYPCRKEWLDLHNISDGAEIICTRNMFLVKETLEEIISLIKAA